ncbi:MAG: Mrp/NBP35 family ATP-binding protein [Fimbriimonadaceae bacterium]|nr:Mrp/NBP35 family ATP-binding protein [Fimbriimonadaceae bacterium]
MSPTADQILDALRAVQDPDLRRDIVTLGFVKELVVSEGDVSFTVELTTPACPVKEELEAQAREAVLAVPGVESVEIQMTAQVRSRGPQQEDLVPGVRQILAVASGKGGVGKSTVTVNLAIALARQGARVGLMDADVYGPSIPLMMGCPQERPLTRDSKIIPIERYGLKIMSLGFLLEEGQAVLWRGPMVAGTVRQLLADVAWGELDYLLVDLPPGTGDAPMSLAQLVPLSGVVLVTTPHNVAANIAGKAAALFKRLNAPILGVAENMAVFVCPHCGQESRVFAGMSGGELAKTLGVPFLGSVPLDPMVSEAADRGVPSLIAHPDRPQADSFREMAGELARQVSIRAAGRAEAEMLNPQKA